MDTSLLFLSFQGFIPKTATYGNFFGCSMYGNIFLVFCFTNHRAPTVELSFFSLSKCYLFFLWRYDYQPLCCGRPWAPWTFQSAMEFDLQNSRILLPDKFLSIIAIWKVFGIQTWKCILQCFLSCTLPPHIFWTLMGWAKTIIVLMVVMVVDVISTQLWLEEHKQGKFLKSVKVIHLK